MAMGETTASVFRFSRYKTIAGLLVISIFLEFRGILSFLALLASTGSSALGNVNDDVLFRPELWGAGRNKTSNLFTVDILSVASVKQMDLLYAQQKSFASHISVRNFFNATEIDDADPDCYKYLTWEDVKQISSFCRNRNGLKLSHVFHHMRGGYAREQWLEKKANPSGWMCAQVRPYSGLIKAFTHYKESKQALPDYFIIMDDDTYYNMELFQQYFEKLDSSENIFYAGCLARAPIHMINHTIPFGGFGSILSKGSLQKLFLPINCIEDNNSALALGHTQAVCSGLAGNNVWEQKYFKNGMNLVELMYHYVSTEKFRDVRQWEAGFCMHSDWVLAYFMNYYHVSKHVADPFYVNVPHARIEAYQGSEIYRRGTGFCKNEGNCKEGSDICHRASPEWMQNETKQWRIKFPKKFFSV